MDDRDLRCPTCRSLDWYRDGFTMYERDDGRLVRVRLTASADLATPWSCATCGFEVEDWTTLHRSLEAAQDAAE
jgi:DNA-directed RNA polymerase subunit RPC12/RpoP